MVKRRRAWLIRLAVLGMGTQFVSGGCLGAIQRELEVLIAPQASPSLIRGSALFDWFGPELWQFLKFW